MNRSDKVVLESPRTPEDLRNLTQSLFTAFAELPLVTRIKKVAWALGDIMSAADATKVAQEAAEFFGER